MTVLAGKVEFEQVGAGADGRARAERGGVDDRAGADRDVVADLGLDARPAQDDRVAPARKSWPMASVPPSGELIVTCRPVCAIEPMMIGWPSSARIELARPRWWATCQARCPVNSTGPMTRAGKLKSRTADQAIRGRQEFAVRPSWCRRRRTGRATGWPPRRSAGSRYRCRRSPGCRRGWPPWPSCPGTGWCSPRPAPRLSVRISFRVDEVGGGHRHDHAQLGIGGLGVGGHVHAGQDAVARRHRHPGADPRQRRDDRAGLDRGVVDRPPGRRPRVGAPNPNTSRSCWGPGPSPRSRSRHCCRPAAAGAR